MQTVVSKQAKNRTGSIKIVFKVLVKCSLRSRQSDRRIRDVIVKEGINRQQAFLIAGSHLQFSKKEVFGELSAVCVVGVVDGHHVLIFPGGATQIAPFPHHQTKEILSFAIW